jgi:hypothetical protein
MTIGLRAFPQKILSRAVNNFRQSQRLQAIPTHPHHQSKERQAFTCLHWLSGDEASCCRGVFVHQDSRGAVGWGYDGAGWGYDGAGWGCRDANGARDARLRSRCYCHCHWRCLKRNCLRTTRCLGSYNEAWQGLGTWHAGGKGAREGMEGKERNMGHTVVDAALRHAWSHAHVHGHRAGEHRLVTHRAKHRGHGRLAARHGHAPRASRLGAGLLFGQLEEGCRGDSS